MDGLLTGVTALTAIGCGLVAGVFFAFSAFVMRALGHLSPAQGMAAMQAINAAAIPSTFFFTGFATMLGCLGLAGWAVIESQEPFAPYLLAGSALYVAGSMVITVAFNLPRNDALATVDPEGTEAADRWARYLVEWTFWNHVRAAGALAASAALIGAVLAG